jgi:hypothetical protein
VQIVATQTHSSHPRVRPLDLCGLSAAPAPGPIRRSSLLLPCLPFVRPWDLIPFPSTTMSSPSKRRDMDVMKLYVQHTGGTGVECGSLAGGPNVPSARIRCPPSIAFGRGLTHMRCGD